MMTQAIWLSPGEVRFTAKPSSQERWRFSAAMLLSGFVHVILLAILIGLWHPMQEEDAPPPIPIAVIEEQEGASGASGDGNSTTLASAASEASANSAAAQTEPTPTPQPEAAVTPPPAEAPTVPPTPERSVAAEALPVPAQTIEPVPPHKPVPPHPAPPQAVAQAETTPQPPTPAAQEPTSSPTQSSDVASDASSGGRGRGEEGAGRAAIGNGSLDGPGDDYLEQVQRWVARFRTYPQEAVAKKEEGTVSIGFKFARDGTVIEAWIAQGSGYALLDDAALKMIRAASPIPKVPEKYKGETLTLVMPERFKIGVFDRLFH